MMIASNRMMLALALAAATALALGCGDDDRPAVDSGPGGTDSGPGVDSGPAGMCEYGPTTMDGCTDADDMMALGRMDFGPDMDETLADMARREGTNCFIASAPDLVACVRDALVDGTDMAVSANCATCFGVSVACSADLCAGECIDGGEDCDMCRCGDNDDMCDCVDQFSLCSGIPSTSCM